MITLSVEQNTSLEERENLKQRCQARVGECPPIADKLLINQGDIKL
jgi:hypothetical protein